MLNQRMTDHLAAVMVDYGHRFAAKFLAEGERRQTTGAEPSSRGLIQGKILVNRGTYLLIFRMIINLFKRS